MTPDQQIRAEKIPVALVYWGRLGAGAALMDQIADALGRDTRFDLYGSASRQSELPPRLAPDRSLAIDTFAGPVSLILRTLLLPMTLQRLIRHMSDAGISVIVTVMPHIWGAMLQAAARRAGIRTILIVHDADPHPGERRPVFDWLVRREIRGSDRVVTLSNHVADRLIARGDVMADRVARLYHPIFRFGAAARQKPGPASPFRLLFFGRILPYKGVSVLLEAYALLRNAGVDCTLRIAGRGDIDAPPHLTAQPGLTIEQGWIDPAAIPEILADADAMVLPYLEASQSGVIAAAYGADLPVVATPVGGLIEQVAAGETGLLAKNVTAGALAQTIRELIETPGLYEACKTGVRHYADAHGADNFARLLGDRITDIL